MEIFFCGCGNGISQNAQLWRKVRGGGYIAVDFFFVVSGYFMIQHFMGREQSNISNIGKDTVLFLLNKMKNIYPYLLISCVASYFLQWGDKSFFQNLSGIRYLIFDLSLLNMTGFADRVAYGSWYISAMFLGLFILFPMLFFMKDIYIYVMAPLAAILIYGWISINIGYIRGTEFAYYGILRLGVWRAIAGLCTGSVCWLLSDFLSKLKLNIVGKFLISFGILFSVVIIVSNAVLYPCSQQDFFSIVFIVILVALVFSQKGIFYFCYNPKLGTFLRKWSMALFLTAGIGESVAIRMKTTTELINGIMWYVASFISAGVSMVLLYVLKALFIKYNVKYLFIEKGKI